MQSKLTVMIADRNAYDRKAMRYLMESMDCEVLVEESDGSMVLEQFQRLRPDLLILDLVMPTKNGYEMLQEIFGSFPSAFVIVFSSISDLGTIEACIELGVANYILKNTPTWEVQSLIKETIEMALLEKQSLERAGSVDERRKHRRFQADGSLFGELPFAPGKLGRIVNVSVGGLAFQYKSDRGSSGHAKEKKTFPLDIFQAGREMEKLRVFCETIYDSKVSKETSRGTSTEELWGVKFVGLTESTKSQLRSFIENQTIREG
jgi:two-component system chemotaxis response regulator CheY